MEARWVRLWTFVLVVFLSCPLPPPVQAAQAKGKAKGKKAAPVVQAEEDAWPPAEVTVGFVTRESESEGLGDVVIPLWNPGEKGLLFLNPRASFTDHNEEEGNLGIGYRQLLPKPGIILGVNAYYDYRDTDEHHYDQWGVGVEMLSDWVDARANYYDPDDDAHVINRQTETSTRQSAQTQDRFSDPYAVDHYIVQDYTTTHTLTTITSTRTFEQFEAAYGGYDLELGLRLPLPIERETLEARVFGGYYDFDNDYTDDAKGWKARAEVRVMSSLFLDAGVYEDDDLTGSDWFAGARLSVPLDLAKISQGRNPFSTAGSRLNGEARDLSARLTEMVMRDSQIRVETSGFIENESLATETVTRESHSDRETIPLMTDVTFVDGDEGAAMGDGSAENPYATIQQGVDAVYGTRNVYVFDASTPYEENVVLTRGVTLWGSGDPVHGMDGALFGGTVAPVVDGSGVGPSITMADHSTVRGFLIRNTASETDTPVMYSRTASAFDNSRLGILGYGATDLTITGNRIAGNQVGVLLVRQGDFQLDFSRNQVTDNRDYGMAISASGNSGTCDITISNSSFDDNGRAGLEILASTYDQSRIRIQNSGFEDNGGNGCSILQENTGDARTSISRVLADGNAGDGIALQSRGNTRYRAVVEESALTGNGNSGFGFTSVGDPDVCVRLQDSLLANNAQSGARQVLTDGGEARVQVAGCAFTNNGTYGLQVEATGNGLFAADIGDSMFLSNAGDGLEIASQQGATTRVSVVDSAFVAQGLTGADIQADGGEVADIRLDDVFAGANGAHGVFAQASNVGDSRIAMQNTTANANHAMGIYTVQTNSDVARVEMAGMVANGNTNGIGIEMLQMGNVESRVGISNSTANGNGEAGIAVIQSGSDLDRADVRDSGASQPRRPIALTQMEQVSVWNSTADGNAGTGLVVVQEEAEIALATVSGMQANDNGSFGILVNQEDVFLALANLSDSTASRNTNSGIWLAQSSMMASVGVVGMPEGVEAGVTGLAARVGLELPDELMPLFSANGGVTANQNGGNGVQAMIQSDGLLALGGYFDITANSNGVSGVQAFQINPDGMAAIGLAGSTETWGALVDLGSQIAQLDELPLLLGSTIPDHMQLNGNGFSGLQMMSAGGTAAINVLAGIEATDNAMVGIFSYATAEDVAANALLRIQAVQNGVGIAAFAASEDMAAVNLLADVYATHNTDSGVMTSAQCEDGVAALLGLSTDALRPLEAFASEWLGVPITVPGEPFGPIVTSDNGGFGVLGVVQSGGPALAALLDIRADRNGQDGINLGIHSDEAGTYSVIGSSDLIYDVVNEAFEIDPPFTNAALGVVSACGNGSNGIVIAQGGADQAFCALGGIEASGNAGGAGIALDLAGIDLDAQVLVANVTANSNGTQGVALDLFSLNEDSIAALIDVEASYNGQQGVQFVAESEGDDVIALMAGVDTAHNGREGIHATLTAGEYAALAMTGVESTYNGTNGATVVMNAGDDADFFAGTNAAPDLDTLYDFFDDIGPLSNRVPFGPVRFDYNGGDGLNVDLTSTARGNATALFAGGTASSNTGNGIMMAGDAYASTGQVDLIANDVVALGNGGGVDVDQFARVRQAGGSCTLIFSGVADTVNQHSTFDP